MQIAELGLPTEQFIHEAAQKPAGKAERFATEQPGKVFGREFLPVTPINTWVPDDDVLDVLNALNGPEGESKGRRRSLTHSLHNNTASLFEGPTAVERPVSAYFTYKPEAVTVPDDIVKQESIIIEWGIIDPESGLAKLHEVLDEAIPGIRTRRESEQGIKLSSGHLAKLKKSDIYIALFDNIDTQSKKAPIIKRDSPLGKTINTLYANKIIPVDGSGFVILPAFAI